MADDAIKGVFVKDDALNVTRSGLETFNSELLELLDAGHIFNEERETVRNAIMNVLVEGLMPAFEHLRKIRASVTQPMPELNRRQLHEDFARVLWRAYKDLFPKAVQLLGFDIGFLFQKEANFETGLADFVSRSPSLIWMWQRCCDGGAPTGSRGWRRFAMNSLSIAKPMLHVSRPTMNRGPWTSFLSIAGAQWPSCSLSSSRHGSLLRGRSRKFRLRSETRSA